MTSVAFPVVPVTYEYKDALAEIVARAREGDADALEYVFDHLFYDVYHEVFVATRDRRLAERATRKTFDRLPGMLRSGRYGTLDELRAAIAKDALGRGGKARLSRASSDVTALRAATRHLVLTLAAAVAAAGALTLAI
jgi:hypothetical protein